MPIPSRVLFLPFAFLVASTSGFAATCASPVTILDLREDSLSAYDDAPAAARDRVVRDVFGEANEGARVGKGVTGAFTQPGRTQTVHLVQRDPAVAADPRQPEAILAVYDGERLAAKLPTSLGSTIQSVVKGGPSKVDTLVLRVDFYNMGQGSSSFAAVDLDGGALHERRRFDAALEDACGDERFGGFVEATVISACTAGEAPPAWSTTRWKGRCVDGKAPAAKAFEAISAGDAAKP